MLTSTLPPLVAASQIVNPVVILVLCVVAGVGTVLMLPGRKETAWSKVGGVIALAVCLIFGALLVRFTATQNNGGMGVYFWLFSFMAIVGALRVVSHPRPVYSALYFVLTVMATAGLFILLWAEFMAAALVIIYAGAILVTYVFVIMLAQQAQTPGTSTMAGLADYDNVSREPIVAAAIGFALMGVLLFVIFDKADGIQRPAARIDVNHATLDELRTLPGIGGATAAHIIDQRPYGSAYDLSKAGLSESDIRRIEPLAGVAYDGTTQQLGLYLFYDQLVNLELAGLILTISMVGAIVIARRRIITTDAGAEFAETAEPEMINHPLSPLSDDPKSIPVYGTDNPRAKAYPER